MRRVPDTPLIIGLDPGTTVGIAALRLDGSVALLESSKNVPFSDVVALVARKGRPVVVATDKRATPAYIKRFATKCGARVIRPAGDMLVTDKQGLTRELRPADDHQRDALAAALAAWKGLRPLIAKIDRFVAKEGMEAIRNRLHAVVLAKENISIRLAADILAAPDEETTVVMTKAVEEKRLSRADFLLLYARLQEERRANALLRGQNRRLQGRLSSAARAPARPTVPKGERRDRARELSLERQVSILTRTLREAEKEKVTLASEQARLTKALLSFERPTVLKRIGSLTETGIRESGHQLRKGDLLYVEDPTAASALAIASLKGTVSLVVSERRPGRAVRDAFPHVDAAKLRLSSVGKIVLADAADLERAGYQGSIVDHIISEYRTRRQRR
ncbi:DUF460 domain-containing protein [Candidatus Woesearchaeota archaeon]|nr:DUF460 domain-containing protein [Candidatus Woesearchaeota archaeon]